ncbi:MAG: hypothetical protein R3A52_10685 [Polyangiales bacterium]
MGERGLHARTVSARAAAPRRATELALLDALATPFDRLRRACLGALGPLAKRVVAPREARVATVATAGITAALALTAVAPLWLLTLGPLAWGVAHLVADLRYLAVRPGLHRRAAAWVAIGLPVAVAGLTDLGTRAGLLASLGAVVIARGAPAPRRALALTLAASAWALSLRWPRAADLVFAHAHNLLAVALWWAWRARAGRHHLAPLALFAAAVVAILAGALDPLVAAAHGWTPPTPRLPLGAFLLALAPLPEHLTLARRLVLLFAFAQSVHYLAWVRLIPDEARPSPSPRSFRQSARALSRDLGAALPVAALALAAALVAWATFDVAAARAAYLRVALFHGHLELAAVALLALEGRRP